MRRAMIGAVMALVVVLPTAALAQYPPSPSPSSPSAPSPSPAPTPSPSPSVLPTATVSPPAGGGGGGGGEVGGVEVVRPGAGGIAFTGADVTWGMLLATALLVAGIVLLAAARRRSHTD